VWFTSKLYQHVETAVTHVWSYDVSISLYNKDLVKVSGIDEWLTILNVRPSATVPLQLSHALGSACQTRRRSVIRIAATVLTSLQAVCVDNAKNTQRTWFNLGLLSAYTILDKKLSICVHRRTAFVKAVCWVSNSYEDICILGQWSQFSFVIIK